MPGCPRPSILLRRTILPKVCLELCDRCLQLVVEVVQQLSRMFQPEMRIIKKQIESLIDREYLSRGDQSEIKYQA